MSTDPSLMHQISSSSLSNSSSGPSQLSDLSDSSSILEDTDGDYPPALFCRAKYPYTAQDSSALSFLAGDIIEVLTQQPSGWWDGLLGEERGWFPSNYVEIIGEEELMGLGDGEGFEPGEGSEGMEMQVGQRRHSVVDMGQALLSSGAGDVAWLEPELGAEQGRSQGQTRPLVPAAGTGTGGQGSGSTADFWVPQVASNGQIFYVNTKTGQQSRDLPLESDDDDDGHSALQISDLGVELGFDALAGMAIDELSSGGTNSFGGPATPINASFGLFRRSNTPEPWTRRLADDGLSYYYLNKADGRVMWTRPEPEIESQEEASRPQTPNTAVPPLTLRNNSTPPGTTSTQSRRPPGGTSGVRPTSVYSDTSDIHPSPSPSRGHGRGHAHTNSVSSGITTTSGGTATAVDSHSQSVNGSKDGSGSGYGYGSEGEAGAKADAESEAERMLNEIYEIAAQLQHALLPPSSDSTPNTSLPSLNLPSSSNPYSIFEGLMTYSYSFGPYPSPYDLASEARRAIRRIVDVVGSGGLGVPGVGGVGAVSPIGSRGNAFSRGLASSLDSLGLPMEGPDSSGSEEQVIDQDTGSRRMDVLISAVVMQVRNLLYVANAVPGSGGGHSSSHSRDHGPNSSSHRDVGHSRDHSDRDRHGKDHHTSSPLKPSQRKLTATLSRLVLSARAIRYDSGAVSYENTLERISSDAEELERAVRGFETDLRKVLGAGGGNNTTMAPGGIKPLPAVPNKPNDPNSTSNPNSKQKRLLAVFDPSYIGLGLVGAGKAGGWSGFGYVSQSQSCSSVSEGTGGHSGASNSSTGAGKGGAVTFGPGPGFGSGSGFSDVDMTLDEFESEEGEGETEESEWDADESSEFDESQSDSDAATAAAYQEDEYGGVYMGRDKPPRNRRLKPGQSNGNGKGGKGHIPEPQRQRPGPVKGLALKSARKGRRPSRLLTSPTLLRDVGDAIERLEGALSLATSSLPLSPSPLTRSGGGLGTGAKGLASAGGAGMGIGPQELLDVLRKVQALLDMIGGVDICESLGSFALGFSTPYGQARGSSAQYVTVKRKDGSGLGNGQDEYDFSGWSPTSIISSTPLTMATSPVVETTTPTNGPSSISNGMTNGLTLRNGSTTTLTSSPPSSTSHSSSSTFKTSTSHPSFNSNPKSKNGGAATKESLAIQMQTRTLTLTLLRTLEHALQAVYDDSAALTSHSAWYSSMPVSDLSSTSSSASSAFSTTPATPTFTHILGLCTSIRSNAAVLGEVLDRLVVIAASVPFSSTTSSVTAPLSVLGLGAAGTSSGSISASVIVNSIGTGMESGVGVGAGTGRMRGLSAPGPAPPSSSIPSTANSRRISRAPITANAYSNPNTNANVIQGLGGGQGQGQGNQGRMRSSVVMGGRPMSVGLSGFSPPGSRQQQQQQQRFGDTSNSMSSASLSSLGEDEEYNSYGFGGAAGAYPSQSLAQSQGSVQGRTQGYMGEGNDDDDQVGLEDAFGSRPMRRFEPNRYQGPQSPDSHEVPGGLQASSSTPSMPNSLQPGSNPNIKGSLGLVASLGMGLIQRNASAPNVNSTPITNAGPGSGAEKPGFVSHATVQQLMAQKLAQAQSTPANRVEGYNPRNGMGYTGQGNIVGDVYKVPGAASGSEDESGNVNGDDGFVSTPALEDDDLMETDDEEIGDGAFQDDGYGFGEDPLTPKPKNISSNNNTKSTTKISKKVLQILGEDAPPWFLLPTSDSNAGELLVEPDKSVKGGTVAALVERLTAHDTTDPNYSKAFLMTFKSFTTLNELFDHLVQRFRIQPPEGLSPADLKLWNLKKKSIVQFRVINTFKSMLTDEDILEKDDLYILQRMKDFVTSEDVAKVTGSKPLAALISRVEQSGETKRPVVKAAQTAPAPIIPKSFTMSSTSSSKKLKLNDIDPLELARQLTLFESALYQKIRPMECLQRAREQKSDTMDNIAFVIQTSNRIADWVAESVLSKEDSRKRAAAVKHLILVADRCRSLNNFSTMIAIVSGLNTPPIRRLKRTWEQVSQRHMAQFGACEVTLDSNRNFNKYRVMLASVVPPCVPFIGVFLSTLQFIQDGNKDLLSDGMVNFKKRQMASEVISDIKRWQAHSYNFQVVPVIREYIEESLASFDDTRMSSDRFWQMSLEREPREREDEKMARLLQESGFL